MDDNARRLEHPFAAGWFVAGLYLFGIGIAASIGTMALALVPQMQTLAALALAAVLAGRAIFGALVSALGIRLYHPVRWRALQAQLTSLGDSLRDATGAIGEPRSVAYARTPVEHRRG